MCTGDLAIWEELEFVQFIREPSDVLWRPFIYYVSSCRGVGGSIFMIAMISKIIRGAVDL